MHRFLNTILLLCCMICPAIGEAAGEVKMDALLIGSWSASSNTPGGDQLHTTMTLNPDATFTGATALNGKIVWAYSGTWALQQRELVWTHKEDTRPLPESPRIEVDEIISLDADHLVLLSKASGVQHSFARVR